LSGTKVRELREITERGLPVDTVSDTTSEKTSTASERNVCTKEKGENNKRGRVKKGKRSFQVTDFLGLKIRKRVVRGKVEPRRF